MVWCACPLVGAAWWGWFVKWQFPWWVWGISGMLCETWWTPFAILGFVILGLVLSVFVFCCVYLCKFIVWFPIPMHMDMFLLGFNSCHWLLQLNISFHMSSNPFSNVGIHLSHQKYKGYICTVYLLLMHIPSFFICFISPLCTLDLQNYYQLCSSLILFYPAPVISISVSFSGIIYLM